jgi:UDP-N-acetylglucosamine transferase subunit ALG13
VTVGTDHHPFNRLMDWAERLVASDPSIALVVQHGTSTPPARATAHEILGLPDLEATLAAADAVVTHGGPGSIMDARASGHQPVVVPRERRFGEHVDDHQVLFTSRLAKAGEVHVARTEDQFRQAVGQALRAGTSQVPCGHLSGDASSAVAAFSALVDELRRGGRRRLGAKPRPSATGNQPNG